jgi:hypothetical protein
MKTLTFKLSCFVLFSILLAGCVKEGPRGRDADVFYSEWFTPSWTGTNGDWYYTANAPDLTSDVVEGGVVLGYVSFAKGDVYDATVRPLPCYALGANWDFLIPGKLGQIQYTSDATNQPGSGIEFRFIAIPGNIIAKSAPANGIGKRASELRGLSYKEVCKLYNIPE